MHWKNLNPQFLGKHLPKFKKKKKRNGKDFRLTIDLSLYLGYSVTSFKLNGLKETYFLYHLSI